MFALRPVALIALSIVSSASLATTLELEISGEVVAAAGTRWRGPGPVPDSFHGSIVIDSTVFSSRSIDFEEHDPRIGRRLENYRFVDVPVASISIAAGASQLWNGPAGLMLTFEGDNPSPQGLGGYFAGIAGNNSSGQSLLLSYDTFPGLTEEQALSQGDVLANILLSRHPFVAGTYRLTAAQGEIAGPVEMRVVEIPEPAPLSALLIGLIALCHALRSMRGADRTYARAIHAALASSLAPQWLFARLNESFCNGTNL